jgi:hypothetical protein
VVTTITIGTAQKMFGTNWHVYVNSSTGAVGASGAHPEAALRVERNVDTIAGLGHVISAGSSSAADVPSGTHTPRVQPAIYGGGTPTRTEDAADVSW